MLLLYGQLSVLNKNKVKVSKSSNKLFSIIIPVIAENYYLFKNLEALKNQKYNDFELLIISENKLNIDTQKYKFDIKILKENIFTPGQKRNIAAMHSDGEYLAFIDDDAYPDPDWLLNASKRIEKLDNKKFILGGPGILPDDESLFSKIIDLSFRSFIYGSAKLRYEATNVKETFLDDWPSVNMIIPKKTFFDLGGFDINYWPGEDTKLCKNLINSNGKIFYQYDMIVKHYRRSNILKHIRQIFRYSFTRGKFFQKKDNNSYKKKFILPSIFLLYFLVSMLMNYSILFIPIMLILLIFYIESLFKIEKKNYIANFFAPLIVFFNILIYGFGFAFSFLPFNYKTKLGR